MRVLATRLSEPIDREDSFHRINRVPQSLIKEYFDPYLITVTAEPGDVLLFDRYVLHDTLIEPSMPLTRISIDIRHTIGPARLPSGYCDDIREIIEN